MTKSFSVIYHEQKGKLQDSINKELCLDLLFRYDHRTVRCQESHSTFVLNCKGLYGARVPASLFSLYSLLDRTQINILQRVN